VAIGGVDPVEADQCRQGHADAAAPTAMAEVFQAAADARAFSARSTVQDWNQATNMVITGEAGGQIMGDWAQGEFQIAGQVAGEDYECLPGLGVNEIISTGGDAFYFPVIDDPEMREAQLELASLMLSAEAQVAFNLKKGSLPIRGDVDLAAANDCMKQGSGDPGQWQHHAVDRQVLDADTQTQLEDLLVEFWNDPSYSWQDAQEEYARIIERAN
jgi:glucose/mannose transport system substrate-binding protein